MNIYDPKVLQFFEMIRFCNAEQDENIYEPITGLSILAVFNLAQFKNAYADMVVTLEGIVMEVSLVCSNDDLPMDLRLFGSVTSFKPLVVLDEFSVIEKQ